MDQGHGSSNGGDSCCGGGSGGSGGGQGGHDGHEGGGMDHMMMSMSFHTGVKETILFDWWKTTSTNELLIAVFIVGVVAALYEGLKYSRECLLRSSQTGSISSVLPGSTTALHNSRVEPECAESMLSCTHLVQTLLHAVQFTISYMLMLVFMTYNVWLCTGVVAGATIGFYFFGWRTSSVVGITEHCH